MSQTDETKFEQKALNKKGLSIAGLVFAATLSLAACNTVEGIGEDTEKVGEKIQEVSE